MAASALPATLKSVTSTKIGELKKQRQIYEDAKSAIGQNVKRRKLDLDKAQALVDGACKMEGVRILTEDDSEDEHEENPFQVPW